MELNGRQRSALARLMVLRGIISGAIRCYQRYVSPLLPPACRFYPTCSEYMLQAIEKHGVALGLLRGLGRLFRCHPFHRGGYDPVR